MTLSIKTLIIIHFIVIPSMNDSVLAEECHMSNNHDICQYANMVAHFCCEMSYLLNNQLTFLFKL
jgi:hypothetical protein